MKNELNNKNFLLAIVISMGIMLVWQLGYGYFYPARPRPAVKPAAINDGTG